MMKSYQSKKIHWQRSLFSFHDVSRQYFQKLVWMHGSTLLSQLSRRSSILVAVVDSVSATSYRNTNTPKLRCRWMSAKDANPKEVKGR